MLAVIVCVVFILNVSTLGANPGFIKVKDDRNKSDRSRILHMSRFKTKPTSSKPMLLNFNTTKFDVSEISGGSTAPLATTRHLAYVFVYYNNGDAGTCSGSILNHYLVLSAAHCFVDDKGNSDIYGAWVRIGKYSNKGTWYPVKFIDIHNNYFYKTTQNDVALVWISGQFEYPYSTINLPAPKSYLPTRSTVYAAGFGKVSSNGRSSTTALEVNLKYQPYSLCKKEYPFQTSSFSPIRMLCATDPGFPNSGGKDTCQGDSGGPLFIKDKSEIDQVGITSFGTACGLKGSIGWYTNLKTYTSMILEYVDEEYGKWNEVFDYRD